MIARLGGFLRRKGDDEPGAKAIWLGLKEVQVAAGTLQKLRVGGHAGNCESADGPDPRHFIGKLARSTDATYQRIFSFPRTFSRSSVPK
ncbi:hypothetical protein PFI31113_03149 [Pandoraea fibrosis]|uniref:Transposase Tn5 dimerisation domain-containing protein n=2 Tax=Pandoraea fibrosis TaxID=1891094 RepID=A0A5E4WBL3_9BURK|nr:hypothetical protein PFI31113_03149 [Pandoraea fibrosis]